MYPTRSEEEKRKRRKERQEWYRKNGKYDSVMFVEATPDGAMKETIQRLSDKHQMRIKVVERVGRTVKQILQKSDPFKQMECTRPDCQVCRSGKGADCRTSGCVYQLTCREDLRKYRGTTSRSVYVRTCEEFRDWAKQDDGSPLWKHSQLYHGGGDFEVDVEILAKCYGKPSRRKITEAVLIDELPENESMNSKKEWSYVKLSKVGMV